MKVHSNGNRRIWFDPHLRLWIKQLVDSEDNQLGEVQYTPDKTIAFLWLSWGDGKPHTQQLGRGSRSYLHRA